jgi:hypothetical protein
MSKICPFKVKGVVLWIFFISVQYDFEALALQLSFFLFFTFNKFYKFGDNAFVAFEIVQNEWEMSKI